MTEDLRTKQIEVDGLASPVIIWKMNYGFSTDLEDYFTEVNFSGGRKTASIKGGKVRRGWLVFGILEAESLEIKRPQSLGHGLTEQEIKNRLASVRTMNRDVASKIYDAVLELNNDDGEENKDLEEFEKK